jgi:hypothetical protein
MVEKLQAHLKFSRAFPSTTSFLLSQHGLYASFTPLILNFPITPLTITFIPHRLGSVQFSQGTFGWVLATTQPPHQLLRCSGPAFGASINSHRAEAYGLLPIATLLDLMTTFFHSPLPPITIWCDNLSVRANHQLHQYLSPPIIPK